MPVSVSATSVVEVPVVTSQACGASMSFDWFRPHSRKNFGSLGMVAVAWIVASGSAEATTGLERRRPGRGATGGTPRVLPAFRPGREVGRVLIRETPIYPG